MSFEVMLEGLFGINKPQQHSVERPFSLSFVCKKLNPLYQRYIKDAKDKIKKSTLSEIYVRNTNLLIDLIFIFFFMQAMESLPPGAGAKVLSFLSLPGR